MPIPSATDTVSEEPPPGTVKSIIPCTPLAIVKCLEYVGVYNRILPYGDRAYGKTVTIINRFVIQAILFSWRSIEFLQI
jgi:methylenetetrahydrofolate dehydrogenase (NAD+)